MAGHEHPSITWGRVDCNCRKYLKLTEMGCNDLIQRTVLDHESRHLLHLLLASLLCGSSQLPLLFPSDPQEPHAACAWPLAPPDVMWGSESKPHHHQRLAGSESPTWPVAVRGVVWCDCTLLV